MTHTPARPLRSRIARVTTSSLGVIGLTLVGLFAVPQTASAHGWISDPPSRPDLCYTGSVDFECGPIKWEPQSVEAAKGSMQCSGGGRFSELDNESLPWPRQTIGSTVDITWTIQANHSTSTWEYYVDGQLHTVIDDGGALPPFTLTHTLTDLPAGDHKILAVWNIADTPNAFYNCIDVTVGGAAATAPMAAPGTVAAV